jgi:hypothetical protein
VNKFSIKGGSMMNNNNLQHNQFFTIEQDFSPDKITDAERLVMERFSHIYANGPMKKLKS